MTRREKKDLISRLFSSMWWQAENRDHFSKDLQIEYPFAPPGMTQVLNGVLLEEHLEWMQRTVKEWAVEVERVDGPKQLDGAVFFISYLVQGCVHWGGFDSDYDNRCCARVTFENDKIANIKEWSNPLKYLYAAKRSVPCFCVDLEHPAVKTARPKEKRQKMEVLLSRENNQARHDENIDRFLSTARGYSGQPITAPGNYRRFVWFVPPDMREDYTEEELETVEIWTSLSGLQRYIQPAPIIYETDDPSRYYFETGVYGTSSWIGNNSYGGYANRYLKYIEMDNNGFVTRYDEFLNPICKLNGVNKSVPTFPWLY